MVIKKCAFWGIVKHAKMKIAIAEKGNVSILIINAAVAFVSQIFADIAQTTCFALKACAFLII